jgi:hypothetical protein
MKKQWNVNTKCFGQEVMGPLPYCKTRAESEGNNRPGPLVSDFNQRVLIAEKLEL